MKAVLISIKPRWVEKIASGKKTVEVRRTKPKLETPFKVYIYMTMGKCPKFVYNENLEKQSVYDREPNTANGRVIGEFVCDKIDVYPYDCHIGYPTPQYEGDDSFCDCGEGYWITYKEIEDSCLTQDELMDYGRGDTLFGWHISNLVIYEQPKELSEFVKPCNHSNDCWTCDRYDYMGHRCYDKVTRPPQSYLFVEELKGETE